MNNFLKRTLATAGCLALLSGGLVLGAAPAQALSCPPGQVLVDLGVGGQLCRAGGGGGNNGSGGGDFGGGGGSGPGTVTGPPSSGGGGYGPTPGYQAPVYTPPAPAPAPVYRPPAQTYNPPAQTYVPPAQSYNPPAANYSAPAQNHTSESAVPAPSAAVPDQVPAQPSDAKTEAGAVSVAESVSVDKAVAAKTARLSAVRESAEKAVDYARLAAAVKEAVAGR